MPTVMRLGGLRVVIYPNDHRPAHVHVMGEGCEVVFKLGCPEAVPELRENFGFSRQRLAAIELALHADQVRLCGEWERIHGIE
mgnify:FL=1|jgi:hypothetical protein